MRHFTPAVFMCSHPTSSAIPFTRRHNGWFDWTRWIIGGGCECSFVFFFSENLLLFFVNHLDLCTLTPFWRRFSTRTPTPLPVMEFFPALLLCAVGFQSLRQFSFFSRWRRSEENKIDKRKQISATRGPRIESEMGKQSLSWLQECVSLLTNSLA